MATLVTRYIYGNSGYCYDSNGNATNCNSGWYTWGRWVLFGAIIVAGFLFFFLFSCMTARRRRRAGARPFYGTGWAAAPFGHGPATYNNQQPQQEYQNAPPNYQSGGYYGENQGYYGGQQTGTELRQPEQAYRAEEQVYQPPVGPPPSKR